MKGIIASILFFVLLTACADAQFIRLPFAHDTLFLHRGDSILQVKGDDFNAEVIYENFSTVRIAESKSELRSFGKGQAIVQNGRIISLSRWFPHGQIQSQINYFPDSAHWENRQWSEDGILLQEGSGNSNKEYWKFYYSTGELEGEGAFVSDNTELGFEFDRCWLTLDYTCIQSFDEGMAMLPDGNWMFYDRNGAVKVCTFKKGMIVSMQSGDYRPRK